MRDVFVAGALRPSRASGHRIAGQEVRGVQLRVGRGALRPPDPTASHSGFMDVYATMAAAYMERNGASIGPELIRTA